jgi:hypothetical protein
MSVSVSETYEQVQAAQTEAQARAREIGRSYKAVFYGTPQPHDQQVVREDLEAFCGMRTSLLRPSFEDTAFAVGQFRVWQRIIGFCFPREVEKPRGEQHGQASNQRPIAGGGVAERTTD